MSYLKEKYGNSSWNAGMVMTDQTGVSEGHKRCSKQADPRCKKKDGVHPLDNYYRRGGSIKGAYKYRAHCKFCDNFLRHQRTRKPDRIEAYRKYHRKYWRDNYSPVAVNHKPVRILKDPTKMFKAGAEFSKHDFRESLEGGVWPRGMEVLDVETEKVYIILGTRMVPKEESVE